MLFDLIDKILFSKKKIDVNIDDDNIHPYIINRWVSMYSQDMTIIINNTGNRLYSVFDNNRMYYKFLQTLLPRVKNKRIFYIKKAKKQPDISHKDDDNDNINIICSNMQRSRREVELLIEQHSKLKSG